MNASDSMHAIAAEIATTLPDAAARLEVLAAMVGRMERTLDEITDDAMEDELMRSAGVRDGRVIVLPAARVS